jgi:hypothetical protein
MGLQEKIQDIDGYSYKTLTLPYAVGKPLYVEIMNIIGPSIAEIIRGTKADGSKTSIADMDGGMVASAIVAFCQDVTPDKFASITEKLLKNTFCAPLGTDNFVLLSKSLDHFAGRYLSELKVIKFALEVNYSDFLAGLESMKSVVGAIQPTESTLNSQTD